MRRKYDKARTIALITPLREQGYSLEEIERATGVSGSYALRLFHQLGIKKGVKHKPKCPHCGVALKGKHPIRSESPGELRPDEM